MGVAIEVVDVFKDAAPPKKPFRGFANGGFNPICASHKARLTCRSFRRIMPAPRRRY